MAKYRQLRTEFWNDGFVLELSPEEKYFYIYLMTNSSTTQCGVYELPKKLIETQTGFTMEKVDKLLIKFQDNNKIKYSEDTKEILIVNWLKYNEPNNINGIKCVNKELKKVKNPQFLSIIYESCEKLNLDINQIFQGILLGEEAFLPNFTGPYNQAISNEVISKKEEVTKKKEEGKSNNIDQVIAFFKENLYEPRELEKRKLLDFSKRLSVDIVLLALEEAVNYNAKNLKYIENILTCWEKKGLNTIEEVNRYNKAWKKQKSKGGKIKMPSFDEREYDFEELEKKLLGWA